MDSSLVCFPYCLATAYREDQPTGSQTLTSASTIEFTWEITNFSKLTRTDYYSRPFTAGIYSWRVKVYPKGKDGSTDHLSLFLTVADSEYLPKGWAAWVDFSLTVVNQGTPNSSLKDGRNGKFSACSTSWGHPEMLTLEELHTDGFLVNDTLIIQVSLDDVVEEHQADTSSEMLDSYFSCLEEYISRVKDAPVCCSRSPSVARCPTLDEVEDAKRSLKDCLSDLFKLSMKDKLAGALSTLSGAEVGLSAGQSSSVRFFWDRFGEFTSDFLRIELDNAEFEFQKQRRDQLFSEMKECHEWHLSFKELSKQISEEEAECERKMVEIRQRKEKLESDWEELLAVSKWVKSRHAKQEKKVKDAEEKKRIAMERSSRATAAWSSLKQDFP